MWPFSEMSLSTATTLGNIANVGLLLSLLTGVISTFLIVKTTDVKEGHWDAARDRANERIVELTTQGDQLRKDTAEATARALEAQLELEKFKKPRSISPEQRNRLADSMKEFEGQQYFGMVASDVPDAWDVWREISLSLELAGWKRLPPPGLAATQYGPPAGIPLAPQAGVMILASVANVPSENMRLYELAKVLAAKLTDESIVAGAGFTQAQPNTIVIVIGPKL